MSISSSDPLTDQKPAGPASCQYSSAPRPCMWATIASIVALHPGMRNEICHSNRTNVLLARLTFLVGLVFRSVVRWPDNWRSVAEPWWKRVTVLQRQAMQRVSTALVVPRISFVMQK